MSSQSSGQRFADYFAVCGLDTVTGLEPDQITGILLDFYSLSRSVKIFFGGVSQPAGGTS